MIKLMILLYEDKFSKYNVWQINITVYMSISINVETQLAPQWLVFLTREKKM